MTESSLKEGEEECGYGLILSMLLLSEGLPTTSLYRVVPLLLFQALVVASPDFMVSRVREGVFANLPFIWVRGLSIEGKEYIIRA